MTTTQNEAQERAAEISTKEHDGFWALRQEAAMRQKAEEERKRIERYRTQRIAQLKSQLDGLPQRIKQAQTAAADADELAGIWSAHIDKLAIEYTMRLHSERHSGRPARLDIASQEAQAFFFGRDMKKCFRQLALTVNQRSYGQPLIDAESLAEELKTEEVRLRDELAELQLRG